MDEFGERFRRVRESLRLTQVDVAERAYDPTDPRVKNFNGYISKIETGKETNPSLDMLERLARGCGLGLADLLHRIALADEAGTTLSLGVETRRESVAPKESAGAFSSPLAVTRYLATLRRILTTASAILADAATRLADLEQDPGLDPDASNEPDRAGTDH